MGSTKDKHGVHKNFAKIFMFEEWLFPEKGDYHHIHLINLTHHKPNTS